MSGVKWATALELRLGDQDCFSLDFKSVNQDGDDLIVTFYLEAGEFAVGELSVRVNDLSTPLDQARSVAEKSLTERFRRMLANYNQRT